MICQVCERPQDDPVVAQWDGRELVRVNLPIVNAGRVIWLPRRRIVVAHAGCVLRWLEHCVARADMVP